VVFWGIFAFWVIFPPRRGGVYHVLFKVMRGGWNLVLRLPPQSSLLWNQRNTDFRELLVGSRGGGCNAFRMGRLMAERIAFYVFWTGSGAHAAAGGPPRFRERCFWSVFTGRRKLSSGGVLSREKKRGYLPLWEWLLAPFREGQREDGAVYGFQGRFSSGRSSKGD